jgi:AbrB family looped-hinge helix DNA binding protein
MKAVVSEKGQVTIPKRLRDSLGIKPGDVIEFEEEPDGRLVGRKVAPADRLDSVVGIIQLPASVDEIIEEMRGGPYDL